MVIGDDDCASGRNRCGECGNRRGSVHEATCPYGPPSDDPAVEAWRACEKDLRGRGGVDHAFDDIRGDHETMNELRTTMVGLIRAAFACNDPPAVG